MYGNEITRNARLGKMNMILHGDGHSGVVQQNSLENPVDSKFDIVITNMPFAQKITRTSWNEDKKKNETVNNISPLYYNSLAKNSGDGVCLLHCFKSLKKGGRMALVVPEGVLFRQDLKNVRKFLLENAKLETVISLPQGAFLPYTGVKTSILYFTNCHSAKTEGRVWYYEVKNDGFSLDNHRRAIKENDLKKIDYVDFLKTKYNDEDIQNIGFEAIEFEKIKNNSYNLCGNVYRESVRSSEFPLIFIDKLCNDRVLSLQKGKMITKATIEGGDIPVIAGGQSSPYSHNKATHEGNVITISASGAYSGYVWYHDYPIWASDCNVLYSNDETKLLTKYLYYVLYGQQKEIYNLQHGAGQPHIYGEDIKTLQIPLPPISEQKKIVDELDRIQKSIESANDLIKNLKSQGGGIVSTMEMRNLRLCG